MSPAPKHSRRWLQFSLGTMLLLVTVFAVWLGWELKFIRERQAWLRRVADDPENLVILSTGFEKRGIDYVTYLALSEPVTIPAWRRWLGDQALISAILAPSSEIELDDMHRLFPEADLILKYVQLGFDDSDPLHHRSGAGIRRRIK